MFFLLPSNCHGYQPSSMISSIKVASVSINFPFCEKEGSQELKVSGVRSVIVDLNLVKKILLEKINCISFVQLILYFSVSFSGHFIWKK